MGIPHKSKIGSLMNVNKQDGVVENLDSRHMGYSGNETTP